MLSGGSVCDYNHSSGLPRHHQSCNGIGGVMTIHIGSHVSVYTHNGKFELRGNVVGINRSNPPFYDVQPMHEFSMIGRINGIPAARVRAHYVAPHMIDTSPKHILDEA
jgi:hypothetical protein